MPLALLGISRGDEAAGLKRPLRHVHWIGRGSLAAATARNGDAAFGPLDHARLLAAIFPHIDILPVRFATVLPDEEAVRQFLDCHRDAFSGHLDRLRGTAEMALRIELPRDPPAVEPSEQSNPSPSALSPADYLAARRTRYRRHDRLLAQAQAIADTYLQALSGLFRQWRRRSPEPPGTVRLALLVQREQASAVAQRVAVLRSQRIGGRCGLSGPWPPYSFV
jgi:hypothetical protein